MAHRPDRTIKTHADERRRAPPPTFSSGPRGSAHEGTSCSHLQTYRWRLVGSAPAVSLALTMIGVVASPYKPRCSSRRLATIGRRFCRLQTACDRQLASFNRRIADGRERVAVQKARVLELKGGHPAYGDPEGLLGMLERSLQFMDSIIEPSAR